MIDPNQILHLRLEELEAEEYEIWKKFKNLKKLSLNHDFKR